MFATIVGIERTHLLRDAEECYEISSNVLNVLKIFHSYYSFKHTRTHLLHTRCYPVLSVLILTISFPLVSRLSF
jgi:hypothetical protein